MYSSDAADPNSSFPFKSRPRERYRQASSGARTVNTATTEDVSVSSNIPGNDPGFLFIENDRLSNALSFGFDDDDAKESLLGSSDADSDERNDIQRLRFMSGNENKAPTVTHVKTSQGKTFSQYLI